MAAATRASGCSSPTAPARRAGRPTTGATSKRPSRRRASSHNIVNAENDPAQQQSQAEQAIADDAGVILLVSIDTGSGATIIDQAKDAGVKVVEYDRFNTGGSGGDAYVSFDNVAVGAAMAEVMDPAIDALDADPKRVVLLNGGEEDNNSFLFRQGYAEGVEAKAEAGEWEIVADQHVPAWDNAEAQTIMEQILTDANNEVDAVFAANDGLGNSAANALEAAGIEGAPVSGQDATEAGMQNLVLGRQTGQRLQADPGRGRCRGQGGPRALRGRGSDRRSSRSSSSRRSGSTRPTASRPTRPRARASSRTWP